MIEMHCHILPGIDDGCNNFEESIKTIKQMIDLGYKKIVLTPHYIRGTSYNKNNLDKYKLLLELEKKLKEENINIDLYLGNEIFVDNDILELLKSNEVFTINSTRYLFIELPRNDWVNNIDEIIFVLRSKGFIPIICHPERYMNIKSDYNILDDLIDRGALFQVNFESINGKYGSEAKNLAKYILKNNKACIIGGDVHNYNSVFFNDFLKTKKKLLKLIKEDKLNELMNINPQKIINNEDL